MNDAATGNSPEQSSRTEGKLVAIFLGARRCADLEAVDRIEAVAGRGLVGDRYFCKEGTFSAPDGPDREVTLIEAEAIEALAQDHKITLRPEQARRNLLTRGVALNDLVGRTFSIGAVVLRGVRLCEPCGHLERLTQQGVKAGLMHRGGLRAHFIQGGMLEVGAVIRAADGSNVDSGSPD